MRKKTTAVILAAGSGLRMGLSENKVYLELMGKPVVSFSLEAFAKHPQIRDIILVTRADETEKGKALLADIKKPSRVIVGGNSRQESVYHAILGLDSKYVLIHDAARPLVSQMDITNCIKALKKQDAAVLAYPMQESVYLWEKRKAGKVLKKELYAAQTPQGFHTKILQACHEKHRGSHIATDDSSLLEIEGYAVGLVLGKQEHCKITLPMDLQMVEMQMEQEKQ